MILNIKGLQHQIQNPFLKLRSRVHCYNIEKKDKSKGNYVILIELLGIKVGGGGEK